jgi:hypothetical protein
MEEHPLRQHSNALNLRGIICQAITTDIIGGRVSPPFQLSFVHVPLTGALKFQSV